MGLISIPVPNLQPNPVRIVQKGPTLNLSDGTFMGLICILVPNL